MINSYCALETINHSHFRSADHLPNFSELEISGNGVEEWSTLEIEEIHTQGHIVVTILYGEEKWDDGRIHDVLGRILCSFSLKIINILSVNIDGSLGIISGYGTVSKII